MFAVKIYGIPVKVRIIEKIKDGLSYSFPYVDFLVQDVEENGNYIYKIQAFDSVAEKIGAMNLKPGDYINVSGFLKKYTKDGIWQCSIKVTDPLAINTLSFSCENTETEFSRESSHRDPLPANNSPVLDSFDIFQSDPFND